jgi:hypothetical protein
MNKGTGAGVYALLYPKSVTVDGIEIRPTVYFQTDEASPNAYDMSKVYMDVDSSGDGVLCSLSVA